MWLWLRGPARHSDLLRAEATQWLAGTALSAAVIVAFAAVLVLDRADLGRAGAYVDPALVLVSCAVLIPTPIRMIRETLVELLEGAPDPEVQRPVQLAVNEVREEFGLDDPFLRMTKTGRKLYVEADFLVRGRDWDVSDEDEIRRAILDRLVHLPYDVWLNVELQRRRGPHRLTPGPFRKPRFRLSSRAGMPIFSRCRSPRHPTSATSSR